VAEDLPTTLTTLRKAKFYGVIKRVKVDLIAAGFIPSKDKCEWEPSQEMVWLGFHWDLKCGKLSVPKNKVEEILKCIQDLIQIKSRVKIRVLARFCCKSF
jgi:hypothetical protein